MYKYSLKTQRSRGVSVIVCNQQLFNLSVNFNDVNIPEHLGWKEPSKRTTNRCKFCQLARLVSPNLACTRFTCLKTKEDSNLERPVPNPLASLALSIDHCFNPSSPYPSATVTEKGRYPIAPCGDLDDAPRCPSPSFVAEHRPSRVRFQTPEWLGSLL